MPISVIDKIKPKNNAGFKVVDIEDVDNVEELEIEELEFKEVPLKNIINPNPSGDATAELKDKILINDVIYSIVAKAVSELLTSTKMGDLTLAEIFEINSDGKFTGKIQNANNVTNRIGSDVNVQSRTNSNINDGAHINFLNRNNGTVTIGNINGAFRAYWYNHEGDIRGPNFEVGGGLNVDCDAGGVNIWDSNGNVQGAYQVTSKLMQLLGGHEYVHTCANKGLISSNSLDAINTNTVHAFTSGSTSNCPCEWGTVATFVESLGSRLQIAFDWNTEFVYYRTYYANRENHWQPWTRFGAHAENANYANSAGSASTATNAGNANYATSAGSASTATNSTNSTYATYIKSGNSNGVGKDLVLDRPVNFGYFELNCPSIAVMKLTVSYVGVSGGVETTRIIPVVAPLIDLEEDTATQIYQDKYITLSAYWYDNNGVANLIITCSTGNDVSTVRSAIVNKFSLAKIST